MMHYIKKNPQVTISLAIIIIFVLLALFANWLAPYDPNTQNFTNRLARPCIDHPFGTDPFGRDLLSRIIYGARISLTVGFLATSLSLVAGTILGVSAGYIGGRYDRIIMFFADIFLAFPIILIGLLLIAVLGSNFQNIIIAIGMALIPRLARIARASALAIREMDYIIAARALGLPAYRIMLFHVLPNAIGPIIIVTTLQLGSAIIAEASLSFLGLGVAPPQATWGNILKEGVEHLRNASWISFFSGSAIVIIVLALNIVGDYLRDRLDPRLRGEKD